MRNASAAALWLPPGVHSDDDSVLAQFEEVLAKDVLEDVYGIVEIMEEFLPDEPRRHLAFVAVDPVSRGKSYGFALIEDFLPRCDAEQQVVYLENTNPANTASYRRHGFEVIGEIQAGKAPPMYAMRRDPR